MPHILHHIKTRHLIATIVTLLVAATGSIFASASTSAYGPTRDTFTMEEPARYAVFNSITNNPTIGDERNFVRVGEIDTEVTNLANEVEVVPGKRYLVYIFYHNDASSTYNDPAYNNVGIAFKTRMSTTYSTVITPSEKGLVTATITAENTNPISVWDEAYFTTKSDKVILNYVDGSAKIYNDFELNGTMLPTSLFTETGTLLGVKKFNGIIPGCEEYQGAVSYVLEARELKGTIEKTVSKDGKTYSTEATAAPGDELYFRLTIKNAGDVALNNTTVKDSLPSGLTLVPGSVTLSADGTDAVTTLSDNLTDTGYNIGRFGLGSTAYINYRAVASSDIDCPGVVLKNTATLTYDSEESSGDSKTASARITVEKSGCTATPVEPESTPDEPGTPTEIVNTGPLEIVMAAIIALTIAGAGFYFWRTKHTLKTVQNKISGKTTESSHKTPDSHPTDQDSAQ
ncbi:DUF11 domain-containing protein [Candidatus Saccharibacteria bacterium]|nr:DUF11 domain-containing protein [Candidatus Saccharibacteria bacterium]